MITKILKLKSHRMLQLLGLYGVLFLLPVMQNEISTYSSAQAKYSQEKTFEAVKGLYYDLKKLTCSQFGQEAATDDCKKGIYQKSLVKLFSEYEIETEKSANKASKKYWLIYYLFAFAAFFGNYIEYRNEYLNSEKE